MNSPILILGAGISALGAAYALRQKGEFPVLLEKESTYGGLCGNFTIDGFRFDRFVHLSFTENDLVKQLFAKSCPDILRHSPNPYNIYKRTWIKHPAQNNLFPLSEEEKRKIIEDFKARPDGVSASDVLDYEQWLRLQYGNYFAEHFPLVYTRKYWMCEARNLETHWVGKRLYQPSLEEVVRGAQTLDTPVTYYAKEMRYPARGGYKQFLKVLAEGQDIQYNKEIQFIFPKDKKVITADGSQYTYKHLISSIPLPALINMLPNVPEEVCMASQRLRYTCGYLVSVALKTENIPPYLWWYIYDEDILPARVYSPSLKSPDNAPNGCSSLQMEIYCTKKQYSQQELYAGSVGKLVEAGIINAEDIMFVDIRFEPYANVVFDHYIYKSRQLVRDYLDGLGIKTIGRFGEWDYLWSDQSLMSGIQLIN